MDFVENIFRILCKYNNGILHAISIFIACFSLWYNRKKAITPQVRIYITNKKWPQRAFGGSISGFHNGPDKMLYVENIGEIGFTITNITIDNIEINKVKDIINPEYLLAAKIPSHNIASSECWPEKLKGKVAKIECKTDDGKSYSTKITVSEIY